MLSYQHAYHAGSPADVVKHALWAALLSHLTQKEGTLHAYETHAGRGLYPVSAAETQKTPEYLTGITKLMDAGFPHEARLYEEAIRAVNPTPELTTIPGSPAIAHHVLRNDDHLHLAEAHPVEMEYLKTAYPHAVRRGAGIHLHEGDGHHLIPALIKPGQRTAVLIDPSFEVKSEYLRTVETVQAIISRAPKATVMVWYPLIGQHKKHTQSLIDGLKNLQVSATWLGHLAWNKPDAEGMVGTGQIILNVPYKSEETLNRLLRALAPLLKQKVADVTATQLTARK